METVSRLTYPLEIGNRVRIMIKKNNMGAYAIGRHQWDKVSEQGSDPADWPMDHVQHVYRLTIHVDLRQKTRWMQSESGLGEMSLYSTAGWCW